MSDIDVELVASLMLEMDALAAVLAKEAGAVYPSVYRDGAGPWPAGLADDVFYLLGDVRERFWLRAGGGAG